MSNVVNIDGSVFQDKGHFTPNQVLDEAKDELTSVLLIGRDKGGTLVARTCGSLTLRQAALLAEEMKIKLLLGELVPR